MRRALKGLRRFVVTPYTAKFRPFLFISGDTIPDAMAYAVASDDAYLLGVLSSRIHALWALTTGGRLGVGNDPRYTKNLCFDPFPFPACAEDQKVRVHDLGEALDAHRKRQQELYPDLTITGMYNVMEKLHSGEPLNGKEKVIHEQGLVSILKQIHDDLDAAVCDAYSWPRDLTDEEILERLVALNAERVEEERNGQVRWLRPEFQNPTGAREEAQAALPGTEVQGEDKVAEVLAVANPWPKRLPQQVSAIRSLLGGKTWDVEQMAQTFKGARRKEVEGVLDSLAALGLAVAFETPEGRRWRGVERVAGS